MYECDDESGLKDTVDPRVHVELERLNTATDEINKLELDLDDARSSFRQLLCDSTARVDQLRSKLGVCIERAKPYYEARFCANEALKQTQSAAMRFERANSAHSAAREMVYLAEQGLGGRTLDPAWQEMLNHATQRVNDAEVERCVSESEHKLAFVKHEVANAKVKSLQKELKRAIAKSSLSIRRSLLMMSNVAYRHELLFLPYYEMKAHCNHLLEHQKLKVQHLETKVSTAKLTYADALRNLEQISDEIHQTRNKISAINETISAYQPDPARDSGIELAGDEYKNIPPKLGREASPLKRSFESVDGYKDLAQQGADGWTEINLGVSSPEEEIRNVKPKLCKQKTLPNPTVENEFGAVKSKIKLDKSISNWISRSSAKVDVGCFNNHRRQSLDNLLGPTGEKMKEILSQGMLMLNISSLAERRNSEPKTSNEDANCGIKKIPSPLEKTLAYLNPEDDNSDTESVSSVDMLNDDQISSLMLDKAVICEEVLGTPISEVVKFLEETVLNSSQK